MQVREVMSKQVTSIDSSQCLSDAAELMRDRGVGSLPVGESGRMTGMLTDRDLVVRGMAEGKDPRQTSIREVMTPQFLYVYDDQDTTDAMRMMAERRVRRLPVLDRQRRLVGMLSLGDVSRSDGDEAAASGTLKAVSQPGGEHSQ